MGFGKKLAGGMAALALAAGMGLAACTAPEQAGGDPLVDYSDTSDGVAATVNGVDIGEKSVTAYVGYFRSYQGLESDDDWGKWLFGNGYGPEDVRTDTVDYYVNQEIVKQAAASLGVESDGDAVQRQIDLLRAEYDSDEAWREYLDSSSTTEELLRATIATRLLQEAMQDAAVPDAHASDSEVLDTVKEKVGDSGAKRSSFILLAADDEEAAADVLARVESGELSFEEAVSEYSTDIATVEAGGDLGWDCLQTLIDPYKDALAGLAVGETSGLVKDDSGIYIIRCTDASAPAEDLKSLDDVPADLLERVREDLDATARQVAYSQWLNEYKGAAEIVRNPMPEGLPYYVDLTKYQEEAEAQAAEAAAGESGDEAGETPGSATADDGGASDEASPDGE